MTIAYQWVDSAEQVAALDRDWSLEAPLFVDTEFMRERTFWPQLALVQINNGHGNWLIDPVKMADGEPLKALLSRRTLVMHGCSEDLETFKYWPGFLPSALEDTQIAAALCGYDLQCGYQKIVELTQGVSLPKTATRTDWLRRPLSAEQLEYAVQDVLYLEDIRAQMVDKLRSRDRLGWWQEECARMLRDAGKEAEPDELWRQVKGAASLDGPARRALRALAAWRDARARERNIPRSFVLKDAELLTVVQTPGLTLNKLSTLGLHPSFLRKHGDALLAVLDVVQQGEIPEPLPGMPDPSERALHKRLRDKVNSIATALEVTPEILARRRWLEALARNPERIPEPMTGWRRSLVAEPLLELLS